MTESVLGLEAFFSDVVYWCISPQGHPVSKNQDAQSYSGKRYLLS